MLNDLRKMVAKNFIALVCIIQCLMNPVSYSLRCVHCLADEHGKCLIPSENYELDCTHLLFRMIKLERNAIAQLIFVCLTTVNISQSFPLRYNPMTRASLNEKQITNVPFRCRTVTGVAGGEKFVVKDCALKGDDCIQAEYDFGMEGYDIVKPTCHFCDSDLCNSANSPYIKLSYLLITVAFIYNAAH